MSKKGQRVPKTGPVWHMSAEEATLAQMPRYNAHACSTGAHGDAKYNRAKQKRAWNRELNEGARTRGLLPFSGADSSVIVCGQHRKQMIRPPSCM